MAVTVAAAICKLATTIIQGAVSQESEENSLSYYTPDQSCKDHESASLTGDNYNVCME